METSRTVCIEGLKVSIYVAGLETGRFDFYDQRELNDFIAQLTNSHGYEFVYREELDA